MTERRSAKQDIPILCSQSQTKAKPFLKGLPLKGNKRNLTRQGEALARWYAAIALPRRLPCPTPQGQWQHLRR